MNSIHRGYPIGALFVLVAACAVLAAGVSPLVRMDERPSGGEIIWAVGLGAASGMFVGFLAGTFHFRRGLGLLLGTVSGLVIGIVAGAMALVPSDYVTASAAAMTAGSALVVGVAMLMGRAQA
jgi:hypothetical protein